MDSGRDDVQYEDVRAISWTKNAGVLQRYTDRRLTVYAVKGNRRKRVDVRGAIQQARGLLIRRRRRLRQPASKEMPREALSHRRRHRSQRRFRLQKRCRLDLNEGCRQAEHNRQHRQYKHFVFMVIPFQMKCLIAALLRRNSSSG